MAINTVVLTSGTSWTVPDSVSSLDLVETWGGRAGGSALNFSSRRGAGGGGE